MFAEWMQNNWGSLFHDNIDFWVPYLAESCEAIKNKMDKHYDIQDERFCIAQFIDCIVIPSSRTGGGPIRSWEIRRTIPLARARILLQLLGSRTRSQEAGDWNGQWDGIQCD